MPISKTQLLRNATQLSGALLLILSSTSGLAQQYQLAYLATFQNGSLAPSLDVLGVGPLQEGDSQTPGSSPMWTPLDSGLALQVTRPAIAIGPVLVGVFATPVSFGPGTAFEEQATFINPIGPHEAGTIWTAGAIFARTGGNNDPGTNARVLATLEVADQHLRLNAIGAANGAGSISANLPDDVYSLIFSATNPQPFTLGLLINRVTGGARVSLVVGARTFSRDVNFQAFQANSGPVISAVGPGIAIGQGSGQTVSVQLIQYQLFVPSNSNTNSAATCPENWGPNCRAVPKSH